MDELVMYTRPGCHLCDEMKAAVMRIAGHGIRLREVDISTDAALERRYGHTIPVLVVGGREVAKGRISATDLARALAGNQAPPSDR
jgi:hypothetical protein